MLLVVLSLVLLSILTYAFGFRLATSRTTATVRLHDRPNYYGLYFLISSLGPAIVVFCLISLLSPVVLRWQVLGSLGSDAPDDPLVYTKIANVAADVIQPADVEPELAEAGRSLKQRQSQIGWTQWALSALALFLGGLFAKRNIKPSFRAREYVERVFRWFLFGSSSIAVLTTLGIVGSLIFESVRFFSLVSPQEFLFGTKWSPQIAMRADQVASSGAFGAIPLFAGTLLIAFIAMCVAVPTGLLSAFYFAEYASPRLRTWVKPVLEILAGIPTVVYGFFAALTVAPVIRELASKVGLSASSESALAAGLVMGVMIIPFVSSLADDVICAVPGELRQGSLALGANQSETIRKVVFPAALPGIVGAVLLAISRAVGETMIVVMAAGLAANLTINPLDNVTTVTVQIVTTLIGDQEFNSAKTLSAFALGLVLFCVTLALNVVALQIVKRYREQYE